MKDISPPDEIARAPEPFPWRSSRVRLSDPSQRVAHLQWHLKRFALALLHWRQHWTLSDRFCRQVCVFFCLFWWLLIQRLERATLTDLWKSEEDLWVVQQVVERYCLCIAFLLVKSKVRNKLAHWGRITSEPRYIYGYPWHLPDGTISRWISWPAEGFLEPRALTGYCNCYCYCYCQRF